MTKTVIVVEFFSRLGMVSNALLIQMNKKREQTASAIARMKRQSNMMMVIFLKISPVIKSLLPVKAVLKAVVIANASVKIITLIKNPPQINITKPRH